MTDRLFRTSLLALLLLAVSASAGDWPQFRGPKQDGRSDDTSVPTKWSETENVLWKTKLPGLGTSSPIAVGDAIFVTCYSGYAEDAKNPGEQMDLLRHVVCLDRKTGEVRWKKEIKPVLPESKYQSGNDSQHGYASSTPCSDGKHLFVFFGKTGVFCFDLKGEQVWSKSVGTQTHHWGSGASPVLYKDLVIVNAGVEGGALVALKKSDGEQAWKATGISQQAWGTPVLVDVPGGKQELVLILPGKPGKINGYDPETGKVLWTCEGVNDGYVCPSVVAHDGVVYAIGGRSTHSVAVKAGGTGEQKPLWVSKNDSRVNSPVYNDGHLFWLNEQKGQAVCIDAATGKEVYSERIPGVGRAYASGIYADGKVYYLSDNATAFVVPAKPKFELLSTNKVGDTSRTNASPAVVDGRLLIRTDRHLYCIGAKK
jgi:outer membrane protein assembly factor BamB